jgi:hypothetical protein
MAGIRRRNGVAKANGGIIFNRENVMASASGVASVESIYFGGNEILKMQWRS